MISILDDASRIYDLSALRADTLIDVNCCGLARSADLDNGKSNLSARLIDLYRPKVCLQASPRLRST